MITLKQRDLTVESLEVTS